MCEKQDGLVGCRGCAGDCPCEALSATASDAPQPLQARSQACEKLNADGTTCGRRENCVHNWNPTRFGAEYPEDWSVLDVLHEKFGA